MTQTIKQLLLSSRPISWVNTAYPFVAGYLLASHNLTPTVIIGGLYFLIPYNLTMYGINDVFDYESDIRNPRKGGIEGVKLAKHLHRTTIWAAALSSLPFLIYLFAIGSMAANLVLLFVTFMVLAYSLPKLRFKERPLLDSITSSTHFVGPLVYGLVLVGWQPKYWPFVAAFFLWGMASHAFGAVQDIKADRRAKISSIATFIGASYTIRFSLVLYVVAAGLLATTGIGGKIAGLLSLLYAVNVLRFIHLTDKTCEQANSGWKVFLKLNLFSGFVITLLLIMAW